MIGGLATEPREKRCEVNYLLSSKFLAMSIEKGIVFAALKKNTLKI